MSHHGVCQGGAAERGGLASQQREKVLYNGLIPIPVRIAELVGGDIDGAAELPSRMLRLYEAHRKLLAFKITDNLTFVPVIWIFAGCRPAVHGERKNAIRWTDDQRFQPAAVDTAAVGVIGFGQQPYFSSAVG
ncbi:MAG: hypothetical protein ACLVAW_18940 [Eisenbergiella massiliensis]